MDGNGDPFAPITELSHVSASQEDRLHRCPFAFESNDDEKEEHVESTGILMVSLPESSSAQDVFQTPPEGSVLPSSEEQWLMALDHHPDQLEVDGPHDAVDLGKDSDLGFSEVELTQKSRLVEQNMALEAPEVCVVGGLTDTNTENFDVKLDSEHHQQIFELNEEMVVEANNDDVEVCSTAKRKLDFFLLESRERGKDDLEGEQPVEKGPGRVEIVSILNVLKILKEGCDDEDESLKNVSIIEICRQRGVTFPPPRWQPEGGFDAVDDGGGGVGDGKVEVL